MGTRTERWLSQASATAATGEAATAEDSRRFQESKLQTMEGLLGTEEQLGGEATDPKLAPYSQRYSVSQQTLQGLGGGSWGHGQSLATGAFAAGEKIWGEDFKEMWDAEGEGGGLGQQGIGAFGTAVRDKANELMTAAQAAAEGGDYDEAERLRNEAEGVIGNAGPGAGAAGAAFTRAFTLGETDAASAAQAQLSSPIGKTVGEIVKTGREFAAGEGESVDRYKRSMTESGERALAAAARGVQRASRSFGLSAGGAASSPGAQRAQTASVYREFGAQRAQLHSQAGAMFEQTRMQFARDAAAFGQAWLQNASGVREAFQQGLTHVLLADSNLYMQSAAIHSGQYSGAAAAGAERDASKREIAGAAVQLGATVLGGAAGGPGGAQAGSILGGIANKMISSSGEGGGSTAAWGGAGSLA